MILTENSIVHYLLDKGLIDIATVVAGDFSARSRKSRNNNFIINKDSGRSSYFVKQTDGLDADKLESLNREASFYQLVNSSPDFSLMATYLPGFVLYDNNKHILITDFFHHSVSAQQYYYSANEKTEGPAAVMGQLLASCHGCGSTGTGFAENSLFAGQLPWVFTISETGYSYLDNSKSEAAKQAMNLILKNEKFMELVDLTAKEWKPNGIIHGDCKLSNFLVSDDPANGRNSVKLVDWELADYGDTCWDVAGIMHSYLLLWLTDEILLPKEMNKKIALSFVQEELNNFWNSYAVSREYSVAINKETLEKCTRFCAMKLIHACFEMTYGAETLSPICAKALQMGFNILQSPANAAGKLMGIKDK